MHSRYDFRSAANSQGKVRQLAVGAGVNGDNAKPLYGLVNAVGTSRTILTVVDCVRCSSAELVGLVIGSRAIKEALWGSARP